ncbi:acyl carrier protein-like protein [Yarrowia lipolytica]|uniref:Acyl carrier protein n=3 Tax=Yarrowia lipolytica TaxID=4952 RepID=Q6C926_YARLI|nr:YALI0D14850p [Yarrowia lipolytica CLIB122]6GCS_O Chain O, ACPM1 SUBUNIT [Yarrowia lipolytica]6RFQ_O Chain O, Acyl carrier protein ACPM1 of NADH:Ubiquinone Oxidoreductase (Complex I) [Yarrowia lipolytica]6RFR_O Chain O, Acyl carrier protein ACPM1 of NADH:Ubiquinone Oxidoreductase (Complex I) [Yarrowia lipolytica]6RFS_O Chain O, Acyl carrier protein ACPM1 of NADH:Ubiquinone Oxidoreductase (Complex I) [Yarrowia lipolytica]6Y79_O Chain O, Acyl carrier protein ACPM1 of NADH:Ubiquinone Oxidoreduc|eukprot:XP_502836.1 YALI0D14850p [Yarrowia lipolytica CLIB122]
MLRNVSRLALRSNFARQATMGQRFYSVARPDAEKRIAAVLESFDKISNPAAITPTASFAKDLNLDSLDTVEVVVAIEEEFGIEIPDKEADEIKSVNQAVEYILAQPDAK